MGRVAIISVDGHVTAARSAYRDYIDSRYLGVFDEWVRDQEARGTGNRVVSSPDSTSHRNGTLISA